MSAVMRPETRWGRTSRRPHRLSLASFTAASARVWPAAKTGRCRARRLVLWMAVAAVGLAGCKSPPPPPPPQPTRVSGSIEAADNLNPSVSQRPSPLVLRVYELKVAASFNQSDFMSLYRTDAAALGDELLGKEEWLLQPGEKRPLAKTLSPQTRFIGVVAFYRDIEKATWRTLVAVQPAKSQTLQIRADSLVLTATVK